MSMYALDNQLNYYRLECEKLKQENARLLEALDKIKIFTVKGKDQFETLVTAAQKVNCLDLIEWAKPEDALSSLIYKTADKALEQSK